MKPKLNLLILEDSKAEARLLLEILTNFDCVDQVDFLSYGEEVIPFLESRIDRLPDLIFLDLILPDVNGKIVLQFIKSHPEFKEISIAIRSGFTLPDEEEKCMALGASWFVKKSGDIYDLEQQIKEILNSLHK